MSKLILAFPCMGKTHFAKKFPHLAIDMESSDYMFLHEGHEGVDKEAFKGRTDRVPNPNGVEDYVNAIIEEMDRCEFPYIFISQHPRVVKKLIALGYHLTFIKPYNIPESYRIYEDRARKRGNNDEWINNTLKFIGWSIEQNYSVKELTHINVLLVHPQWYLEEVYINELI